MLLTEIKHPSYTGDKNSQYGTIWVYRGDASKKIKSDSIAAHLIAGWKVGRKSPQPPKPRKKVTLTCVRCSSLFDRRRADRTLCPKCVRSDVGKIAAQRGTHAGWHTRKGEASYPEKYIEDVFNQEGISGWVREKKVGRWFVDFAFIENKIAVEVDGRQHDDKERADSDKRKDEYLESLGWKVIRIKWFNPRTEQGKEKLHPQVKSLLAIIRD